MSAHTVPIEKVGPSHGGKAANRGWLVKYGYRVPAVVVVDAVDAGGSSMPHLPAESQRGT